MQYKCVCTVQIYVWRFRWKRFLLSEVQMFHGQKYDDFVSDGYMNSQVWHVCVQISRAQKLWHIYMLLLCMWHGWGITCSPALWMDVDFYGWHSWVSCVTSSVCRLGFLIIGDLPTLTVHLCKCIWKFSEAFILWPFCEGFGQPHDFINRVIFMTVV